MTPLDSMLLHIRIRINLFMEQQLKWQHMLSNLTARKNNKVKSNEMLALATAWWKTCQFTIQRHNESSSRQQQQHGRQAEACLC